MKALYFKTTGKPLDVLRLDDVAIPSPSAGQVRVRVHACALNPADWAVCEGFLPVPPPRGIGFDVAGFVDALGSGVTNVSLGDPVFGVPDYIGQPTGGAAEYAILKVFLPIPAGLDMTEAAALPMAVETAARSIDLLPLTAGQTLMVNGGGTMTGFAAVQIALLRGAHVIASAGETFADRLRELGAKVIRRVVLRFKCKASQSIFPRTANVTKLRGRKRAPTDSRVSRSCKDWTDCYLWHCSTAGMQQRSGNILRAQNTALRILPEHVFLYSQAGRNEVFRDSVAGNLSMPNFSRSPLKVVANKDSLASDNLSQSASRCLQHCRQRGRFNFLPQIVETKRLEVFFGRGDVFVAEKRLERLDVDAGLEHLRGECVPPLVQIELLAIRSVAAFALSCLAAFAIQFCAVGNLFAEFEQVRVGLVPAVVGPLRMLWCWEDQYGIRLFLPVLFEGLNQRVGNGHATLFVALGGEAKLGPGTNTQCAGLPVHVLPGQAGELAGAEPGAQKNLKDDLLLGGACPKEALQFIALVNLNAFVDGARPVALAKLDVRPGVAHGLEHDDDALVDGLLVEILAAAGGEERHRVRAPELIDVMLLAHCLEPG